jgi:hypothetical protein
VFIWRYARVRKNGELHVAFAAFWRILGISRRFDIRPDVRHRETLVFFTGT